MRNLSIINESEDIVTKEYADQKLPGRPITKYDYDHLSPAEKDADIVYFIIDDDQDALEFDEVPTAGSDNPVKSKGIKSALDAKQNTLTFDQTPTAGSQNPVTSGGVKSALDASQPIYVGDSTTLGALSSGATGWTSGQATIPAGYKAILCTASIGSIAVVKGDIVVNAEVVANGTWYLTYRTFNAIGANYSTINIHILCVKE